MIQDADGLTKSITTSALLTIITNTPVPQIAGSDIKEGTVEISSNLLKSLIGIATMEVYGEYATSIPIHCCLRNNVRTIDRKGETFYISTLSFELPLSLKNNTTIQDMCDFIAQHKWMKNSNVLGLDVNLYKRYYYHLDESYNLDLIYQGIVSNEILKPNIIEAAYILKEHTFILSLEDMSQCDTIMRQYLHKHS